MMKKIHLTAIACVIIFYSYGQTYLYEFAPHDSIGFKGKPANWLTHVNTNTNQSHALITVADKERIFYYLVDSNFTILNNYSLAKDSMIANYYGSKYEMILQTSNATSFKNYIRKQNGTEIFVEIPDFENKSSEIHSLVDYSNKEKFLTAFENNNHVYFLTLFKGTNKIRIYTDSGDQKKDIELVIADSTLHFELEKNLKNIKVIKDTKEPDLYTSRNEDKLYIRDNREVLLSFDDDFQYTLLFTINLDQSTSQSKIIRKNFFYCNGLENANAVQSNSFIYQNKILQGVFCSRHLFLQLKDISTDSLIMEFHASRDSAISFASSGLIKREQGTKSSPGILWLQKRNAIREESQKSLRTKDFFRAVNRSSPSFVIVNQGDFLVVKIGEAHDYSSGGGGGAPMYMGGGTVNTPGGSVSLPGTWMNTGGGYNSKISQIETYFKTVLKKNTLEFVPEINIDTKYDKVDDAEDRLKDLVNASTAFDFNNKTYLFYWQKKEKKFIIEPIE